MEYSAYLRIVVYGDSIAWGASDFSKGGWAERLRIFYASRKMAMLYNQSVPAFRSEHLLKLLRAEIPLVGPSAIAIVSVGVNDSKKGLGEGLAQYKANLASILEILKKTSEFTIFLGLTRVDEAAMQPPPDGSPMHKNSLIGAYDLALEEFCKKNAVPYLKLSDKLQKGDWADGLHPNSSGHRKIEREVHRFLDGLLIP